MTGATETGGQLWMQKEKRQRTAALQNLAEFPTIRSGAKRLDWWLALYCDRQFQSHPVMTVELFGQNSIRHKKGRAR